MHLVPSFLALSLLALPLVTSSYYAEPVKLAAFYERATGPKTEFTSQLEAVASALKKHHILVTQVDCAVERATKYTAWVLEVTALNLEKFKDADKFVAVASLATSTDAPAAAFSAVKKKHHDRILFGLSTDPEAAAAAEVNAPAIVVYRRFDEPRTLYPSPVFEVSVNDLEDWINELAISMLGEFTELNGGDYATYLETLHWYKPAANILLDPTDESTEALISSIIPMASKYRSDMVFVWSDVRTTKNNTYLSFGLPEPKWPSFFIENTVTHRFFPYDQSKTVDAKGVEEWVKQYLSGQLVSAPKTQPIPEDQTGSVYDLVGAEFDSVVFDDSKDVFIEFYGASQYASFTNISLLLTAVASARINADLDDLPSSVGKMTRYPAFKYKPAGAREFIDYKGDRSFDSLVSFLEKYAMNSVENPYLTDGRGDQLPLGGVDSVI
ncbi:thioredoxin-like domain-containing protein [Mycena leptocephala]|nr:thioredoxin-like domain-containing protein [Mycena leptocephala]